MYSYIISNLKLDLIKCLEKIEISDSIYTGAPISVLPSNVRIMALDKRKKPDFNALITEAKI